jgi:isoquinoline 1-oxidoreductase alpha subunit
MDWRSWSCTIPSASAVGSCSVDVEFWVLRDTIDLKGTKFGCGVGLCGAGIVHLNGKPVRSCPTQISHAGNAAVTTIDGIGDTPVGARLQIAWLDSDVVKCGYHAAACFVPFGAMIPFI